ncbi:hypothetical protein [Paracidovorax citrulli]|uniref:hypothetical protein n=1 Tax=Paracidovorax citrulli TaxID=80869 RepID=UPI00217E6D82|nr:hypothetical protein [Paracidovorax citrulli]
MPAVGVVHPCERFAEGEEAFKKAYLYTHDDPAADAFAAAPHIRGWYIRRTATAEVNTNGRILNEHTWLVRGYLAFRDAISSELIFDDLIERMRDAVRVDGSLGLPGLLGSSVADERGVSGRERGAGVLRGRAVSQRRPAPQDPQLGRMEATMKATEEGAGGAPAGRGAGARGPGSRARTPGQEKARWHRAAGAPRNRPVAACCRCHCNPEGLNHGFLIPDHQTHLFAHRSGGPGLRP